MSLIFSDKKQEALVLLQLEKTVHSHAGEKVVFGYMPANASKAKKYLDFWQGFCDSKKYRFVFIDNSLSLKKSKKEHEKLRDCNVLLITGGNTYELLRNLRKSGFDEEIKKFSKRGDTVIAAFSAGAIVLGPSLRLLEGEWGALIDENIVGIKDIAGLGIIQEEIFPHYRDVDEDKLKNYEKANKTKVIPLRDSEFLVV